MSYFDCCITYSQRVTWATLTAVLCVLCGQCELLWLLYCVLCGQCGLLSLLYHVSPAGSVSCFDCCITWPLRAVWATLTAVSRVPWGKCELLWLLYHVSPAGSVSYFHCCITWPLRAVWATLTTVSRVPCGKCELLWLLYHVAPLVTSALSIFMTMYSCTFRSGASYSAG
jgi:hypothetical protein